jgi:hypothetical protein
VLVVMGSLKGKAVMAPAHTALALAQRRYGQFAQRLARCAVVSDAGDVIQGDRQLNCRDTDQYPDQISYTVKIGQWFDGARSPQ